MKNCKNCKFWGVDFVSTCDFVNTIMSDKDKNTMFVIEAYANDDQGLECRLITGPDFGCIHFCQAEADKE